ncbi:LCP family protein [Nocardia pseudobrasiliensis]|uniref:LytR family transcriptional attenuator n=1 Tax=Nocardia pseudobrasiliensis TaxID=45979 RepID=A0A370HWY7_9NOCA|nr:LCP family protein [Nocardia pseudobrasiliensis]RDI61474.1 LytR family transcriptional attenuator [Nocardia pseudobrasiliensis]
MGDDDRRGRTPGPGGRAPWERYSATEAEPDDERPARRNRYADETPNGPVTVHDLMQKVDSERISELPTDTTLPAQHTGLRAPSGGNGSGAAPSEEQAARPRGAVQAPTADDPVDPYAVERARLVDQPTDILPAADPDNPPPELDRQRSVARPKSVGKPPLSRLAANKQRKMRRLHLVGRSTTALVAVLALVLTGAGWNYLRATDGSFNKVAAVDENSTDIVNPGGQLGDENFLIIGNDTRAGADGQIGAGTTDDAEGARADTVMLVNIPENRQRVVVVSFPRDLDISRPACEGWDNENRRYTGTQFPSAIGDKLNAVYALGGPKCLTNVIMKLSGIRINHFIGLDFSGFQSMVDTVGGVEVCTAKPLVDEELGTVLPTAGKQKINGTTALDYVRARHVQGEFRSDYDRINRQQRFMSSLLRSALSNKTLFDPGRMNAFISAFTGHALMDNVKTNDLLTLGRSLQKVDAGAITFLTVPTAGTTSYGNEIPRESDIKAIFTAIIDDQPLPGEKKPLTPPPTTEAPAPRELTAVDPSTMSVQVSNGSGVAGVAATAANKLSNQGFQIFNVGNYSGGTISTTRVRYSSGHEAEAATVASAIPGATLESAAGLGSIVEVALGADYQGTIRTPVAFGNPLPTVPVATGGAPETPVTLPSDLEHVNAADDLCK